MRFNGVPGISHTLALDVAAPFTRYSPHDSMHHSPGIHRTIQTLPKPKTTLPKPADHTQIIPCQSQIIRRSLAHKKTPPVGGVRPKGGAEGEIIFSEKIES